MFTKAAIFALAAVSLVNAQAFETDIYAAADTTCAKNPVYFTRVPLPLSTCQVYANSSATCTPGSGSMAASKVKCNTVLNTNPPVSNVKYVVVVNYADAQCATNITSVVGMIADGSCVNLSTGGSSATYGKFNCSGSAVTATMCTNATCSSCTSSVTESLTSCAATGNFGTRYLCSAAYSSAAPLTVVAMIAIVMTLIL